MSSSIDFPSPGRVLPHAEQTHATPPCQLPHAITLHRAMASFGSDLAHTVLGVLTAHLHPANPMYPPAPDSSHHSLVLPCSSGVILSLFSLVRSICKAFWELHDNGHLPFLGGRQLGRGLQVHAYIIITCQGRRLWSIVAEGTGERLFVRLVGSVGTLLGRSCDGCSSHECHTINSDFFFGGCGSLSRLCLAHHCSLCSQCLSLSDARCRP